MLFAAQLARTILALHFLVSRYPYSKIKVTISQKIRITDFLVQYVPIWTRYSSFLCKKFIFHSKGYYKPLNSKNIWFLIFFYGYANYGGRTIVRLVTDLVVKLYCQTQLAKTYILYVFSAAVEGKLGLPNFFGRAVSQLFCPRKTSLFADSRRPSPRDDRKPQRNFGEAFFDIPEIGTKKEANFG